ncbi:mannitol dehydrogenase family protein [Sansalvadorimonas verongulae]|uniref:mannitol dehydrogenase family protein n=1 Tax=Sansalvadorimonas verongulae TaxID=2172824 RepID=UPI0012BC646E|nr:mannitol dehydrogenase family protein [Sansalvadorimonas verongulae]MTI12168.1 mannitol dehydrogenase family protein [Sansalvadorimonas verongulae]
MLNTTTAEKLEVSYRLSGREAIQPAIVHLGLGAFHRGHLALISDEFMAVSGQRNWGITSANILGDKTLVENLQAQDNLYTVTEIHPDGHRECKLVSSIVNSLHAEDDRLPLIEKMSEEDTRIVTLTITEKGYCTNMATGELLLDHPLIVHDLANPEHPKTAIGILVAALAARRAAGIKPFTVLSCDNIPDNGKRTRNAVLLFATAVNDDLAHWIDEQCTFPSAVVDRIVPATTQEDLQMVKNKLGVEDKAAVVCEGFRQWIIEDNFVMGRPDWDDVPGVTFVEDVRPYKEMKLRMHNGAHSFLAYFGSLGHHTTISEAVSDPELRKATQKLMKCAAETLDVPAYQNLQAYSEQLLQRFANTELAHKTSQIAMDGSQKITQRWLETICWHLDHNSSYAPLALGLAAWMKYVSDPDTVIEDPMAAELKLTAETYPNNLEARTKAFFKLHSIFGDYLPIDERFVREVTIACRILERRGVQGALHYMNENF